MRTVVICPYGPHDAALHSRYQTSNQLPCSRRILHHNTTLDEHHHQSTPQHQPRLLARAAAPAVGGRITGRLDIHRLRWHERNAMFSTILLHDCALGAISRTITPLIVSSWGAKERSPETAVSSPDKTFDSCPLSSVVALAAESNATTQASFSLHLRVRVGEPVAQSSRRKGEGGEQEAPHQCTNGEIWQGLRSRLAVFYKGSGGSRATLVKGHCERWPRLLTDPGRDRRCRPAEIAHDLKQAVTIGLTWPRRSASRQCGKKPAANEQGSSWRPIRIAAY
ncbi:hypothetical protein TPAR_01783 [Tolypocladium paradoxum]|uniref:Uncharacterized protein n=1 Tax=Tolypocladium paradoxum TaxID=94208 RepID=A0A2S4L6J4_9HYPO|nr:hypothetical protein TPAR_01783 [Tolypocladium paradoxum]